MKLIADKATIAACNSELEAKKVVLQGRIQALEATVAAETAERGRLASELKEPWEASPPGRASINKIFDNNATASPSVPSSLNVLGVVASTTAPLPVATKTTTTTTKTVATKTARSSSEDRPTPVATVHVATSTNAQQAVEKSKDYKPKDVADFKGRASSPSVGCLLYTSPSPRDLSTSRMPSSA